MAIAAWAVHHPGFTIDHGGLNMNVHVTVQVQGEAGVSVGPGFR